MTPDTWRGTLEEPRTQNKYVYAGNNPVTRWDPTGNFSCSLGEDCIEDSTWYFFQGSRQGPSSSWLVSSRTDLDGTYRSYEESSTMYYDYHVIYITWVERSKGQATWTDADVTYSRTTHDSYTTFQPHTQDSRNEYTEDYREARTGPMPEERVIERKTTVEESVWSENDGGWVELVRPPVAGGSAGSQVVTQAIAQALGESYVVQSGDSLWAIAERIYGDGSRWQEIAAANPQLQNPNAIYAGQVLNLPGVPVYHSNITEWDFSDPREGNTLTSLPTLTDVGSCLDPTGCQSSEAGSGVSNVQRVQQYDTMMANTLPLMQASQYNDCLEREAAVGAAGLPPGCFAQFPQRFGSLSSNMGSDLAGMAMLDIATSLGGATAPRMDIGAMTTLRRNSRIKATTSQCAGPVHKGLT